MKLELTKELLEEVVCCIVDCGMGRDEACEYATTTIVESMIEKE